MFQA